MDRKQMSELERIFHAVFIMEPPTPGKRGATYDAAHYDRAVARGLHAVELHVRRAVLVEVHVALMVLR
jgi:hypothetical protein